jgi:hypothetical protein
MYRIDTPTAKEIARAEATIIVMKKPLVGSPLITPPIRAQPKIATKTRDKITTSKLEVLLLPSPSAPSNVLLFSIVEGAIFPA